MIFCWFTHAQAVALAATCQDPVVRALLDTQIRCDLLPDDTAPRAVLLEDVGDGLSLRAVTYFDADAADRAAAAWWAQAVADRDAREEPL